MLNFAAKVISKSVFICVIDEIYNTLKLEVNNLSYKNILCHQNKKRA